MKNINLITTTTQIANHLTTRTESKNHGGYNIYEDEKIIICLDTYYPNLEILIKKDGNKIPVLSRSGHGHNILYRPGQWEKYILVAR